MAMHEEPKKVHELAERVVDVPIGIAKEVGKRFRGRIHGFTMTDDWGTQQSAFVQIPMWREFFKDGYTRLFRRSTRRGCTCGCTPAVTSTT